MIPVAILGAVLFAGVVQLSSKPFGGEGTFEDQFALFSFAYPPYFIFLHVLKLIFFIVTRHSPGGSVLFLFTVLSFIITVMVVKLNRI